MGAYPPPVKRRSIGLHIVLFVFLFGFLLGGLAVYNPGTSSSTSTSSSSSSSSSSIASSSTSSSNSNSSSYSTQASSLQADSRVRTVNSSKCPDWFWQYVRFHKAQRGKHNARYLIMENTGQGLGDRLHGAIGMLRLAKALDRVLLLNWVSPFPIEEFFEPAGALNWTRQGVQIQQGPKLNFINLEGWAKPQLLDGSLARINDTFLTIVTNLQLNWTCGGCPKIASQYSEEAACLWQQMFRPLESITAAARKELQQLYPGGVRPYVAAHLRLGGLVGEWGPPGPDRGKAPLENYLAAVRCTAQLAANSSIDLDVTPALFISDNHNLRQVIQQGHYRRVVAPTGLPVHTAAGKQSLEAHHRSVVDMVLLGWADL